MAETQEMMVEQETKLLHLVHVIVKRKMFIIKTCSLVILLSVVYSLTRPNIYSATAKVLPPPKDTGPGLSALLGQAGGMSGLMTGALGGGGELYVSIAKSRSVSDAVIQRLNLVKAYEMPTVEQTRRVLDDAVRVQAGKDGLVTITAEDKNPQLAAQLANTLVEELGKATVRMNLSKAGTERLFLEKRLDVVKKDLKLAEEDLKNYAQEHKVVQVESQARASIEGIARLKAELASKEVQLSVLRASRTNQSPEVKALETGILRLKREVAQMAGTSDDGEGIPAVGNVPGVGLEYSRRLRVLKTQEAVYEQLTKQYEMAKLNEAKDSSSIQVLDEAVVPLKKCKPARAQMVIYSTVMSFLFSILMAFVMEHLENMPIEDRELLASIKRQMLVFKRAL
ncbi:GumC family protein [Geomesophilobacter sediminis]|uniref:Lipopolysaccharide biosynthesis protein n=1 Tax=Geomesophilobacter sediminis TaxID=2798584 RepID=A0A8J7IKM2_9BACT|nr:Wzz/FepE/Etk N-terminal domain-containing protein [Geomesophilobacter sediminis]MBJ6723153.1 lipopolysaccharide biosynthesis protein [Geomesophilobacter sediminis]